MVCESPLPGIPAGSELACLVPDGEPGFTVFDQNPIHYAIMYRSLLNDMELLATMSKRAAEHAQECVREKIAKEVGDVYQELGENNGRARKRADHRNSVNLSSGTHTLVNPLPEFGDLLRRPGGVTRH